MTAPEFLRDDQDLAESPPTDREQRPQQAHRANLRPACRPRSVVADFITTSTRTSATLEAARIMPEVIAASDLPAAAFVVIQLTATTGQQPCR
jgi:hypothetical protein